MISAFAVNMEGADMRDTQGSQVSHFEGAIGMTFPFFHVVRGGHHLEARPNNAHL